MRDEDEIPERAVPSRFDVVAIGASAGGIEALRVVIGSLPDRLPVAVLIVQHMDPRHRSLLADLLQRHSRLTVRQATDGEAIRPGTVRIARPDRHLVARDRRTVLTETELVHYSRPSIDRLFESVADEYGARAIGVLLSGSGVDGASGIRAIKGKGGTTVVQNPASAAHASMPRAACATGCVDLTLDLDAIGPAIVDLVTRMPEGAHD